jgi:hypothetical protein
MSVPGTIVHDAAGKRSRSRAMLNSSSSPVVARMTFNVTVDPTSPRTRGATSSGARPSVL